MNDTSMTGGNGLIWLIALLVLGNGGFGFGANRANVATTDELSAGFNFAGVNNSLKDLMLGQANINQNLGNAICSSTYELGSKIDSCCCATERAVDSVKFDMANYAAGIQAAIAADGQKTRDLIQQNKIESLQSQINQLQLAQATGCLPRISPVAYGVYPYPTCNTCGCQNI